MSMRDEMFGDHVWVFNLMDGTQQTGQVSYTTMFDTNAMPRVLELITGASQTNLMYVPWHSVVTYYRKFVG